MTTFLLLASCAGRPAPPATSPKPTEPVEPPAPPIAATNTSYVIDTCPDSKKMDSRAAEAAMRKLIQPCGGVPFHPVRFSAILVPGGRIEIASRSGNPAEGVVPICLLKNQLAHSVALKQPCTFDVKLEGSAPVSPGPPSAAP